MSEQLSFDAFLQKLSAVAESARAGDNPDVNGVQGLVGAMGQTFTTTIFAFQQISALKSNMDLLSALVQKYQDPWVNVLAEELFRRPLNTLRTRYALHQTAQLYEQAAGLVGPLTHQQLLTLARRMMEYHSFLARRIRDFLPFYELSMAFEGHKFMVEAEKKATGN